MGREIKTIFNSVDTWECSAFFFITVIICIFISSKSKEDRFLIGVLRIVILVNLYVKTRES